LWYEKEKVKGGLGGGENSIYHGNRMSIIQVVQNMKHLLRRGNGQVKGTLINPLPKGKKRLWEYTRA